MAILFVGLSFRSGVNVEIINLGPLPMKDVSVDVTGASYSLGEIPVGKSKVVKVDPRSESSVSVRYSDQTGQQKALPVGTYIESGYSSKITVGVKNNKIINVKQDIHVR